MPTAVRRLVSSPPPAHTHSPDAIPSQRPPPHTNSSRAASHDADETQEQAAQRQHVDTLRATQSALIAAASSSSAVVPAAPCPAASSAGQSATAAGSGAGQSATGGESNSNLTLPALRHKNLSRFLHTEVGGSIFLNRLRTGGIFLKHGSRGNPHFRFVCCTADLTRVEWMDLKGKKKMTAPTSAAAAAAAGGGGGGGGGGAHAPAPSVSSVLSDSILAVSLGHSTRLLRDRAATSKDSLPDRCFSLCTTTRTLDLECLSEQERDLWHLTFSFLVDYAQKKRTAELKQQQLAQHQQHQASHNVHALTVPGPSSTPQLPRHISHSISSASDGFPGLEPLRPGFPPPTEGPQSQLSLVHALELLCDQSIGQAQARNAQQAQQLQQQQQQRQPQSSEHPSQLHPHQHQAGSEIPPLAAPAPPTLRSSIQSPLHPTLSHLHSEADSPGDAAEPAAQDRDHEPKLHSDEQSKVEEEAAPLEKSLPVSVPMPVLQQQGSEQPAVEPTPPRPSPPTAVPVAVPPTSATPSSRPPLSMPLPLPLPPLDPDLLRLNLLRELDSSREANRRLYIDSAAQMIAMQEQIDALTRENVGLIRALAPAHSAHAQRW